MARSTYVYLVVNRLTREPVGGATVKHELITWLRRQENPDLLKVYRLSDINHYPEPTVGELDIEVLLR